MVTLELVDALRSSRARDELREHGVMTEFADFEPRLRPPARRGLAEAAGVPMGPTTRLVYAGQQIYTDYRHSVMAKLHALAELSREGRAKALLVWSDTDRSGSDKAMTTIRWPVDDGVRSVSLASRATRSMEPRFIELDPDLVEEGWRRLGSWLAQSVSEPRSRRRALARHGALGDALSGATTLAAANQVLTQAMLRDALGMSVPSLLVSTLIERGLLTRSVERLINRIEDFIVAFNAGIERLRSLGFTAHLRPRPTDYLPLYYSCPERPDRVPLVHVREGAESFAVGVCAVHDSHRFSLGRGERTLAELHATGRWSPDVTLPIHLNDLVSGVIAGRSSALYGIVLGWAQREVLGTQPCPVLVPTALADEPAGGPGDSVLFTYLTGVVQ